MITRTPKFLYFLLFLIALTAADALRRSFRQNDFSINKATSPLRKNIIDINRELSEIKVVIKKQQIAVLKLKKQLEKQNKPPVVQSEKTIDIINPDENKTKIEKKIINDKPVMPTVKEDNKLNEFPDIVALAATNVTLKGHVVENVPVVERTVEKPVKKEKENRQVEKKAAVVSVVEINPKNLAAVPANEIKKKQKFSLPKRVTSLPAHTAVPEVSIPDKNPDLTSKTIDEKPERNVNAATSLSQTMLSGKKRGVKVTISDVLESYENNDNE